MSIDTNNETEAQNKLLKYAIQSALRRPFDWKKGNEM